MATTKETKAKNHLRAAGLDRRIHVKSVPEKIHGPELITLPPELLLRIFSFLDSYFLVHSVALVCKLFHKLVNDNYMWKYRVSEACGAANYPIWEVSDKFNWKRACCLLEQEYFRWRNNSAKMNKFSLKSAHYSFIHAVLLLQDGEICVSGSRDCSLKFWNLTKLKNDKLNTSDILVDNILDAHKGWIWTISSSDTRICTGGWDAMVHLWDLQNGCQRVYSSKCIGAVLCTSIYNDVVAAGTYSRMVNTFDTRRGMLPITKYTPHTKAVLDLFMEENYIVSTSEDSTICVFDRRNQKVITTLKCPNYVMTLSRGNDVLFGGDKRGLVHIWQIKNGIYEFVQTLDLGHDGSMTRICNTMGCIVTGCTDGAVKVTPPANPAIPWVSFDLGNDIGDLHYMGGVLAAASSNDITVWKPKSLK